MRIQSIRYWESKESLEKQGLLINEGLGPILDKDGNPVPEVWNYVPDYRLIVELPMTGEEK